MWVNKKVVKPLAFVSAFSLLTACGGGSTSDPVPTVTSISILVDENAVQTNGSAQLTIEATFSDGSRRDITNDILWESGNSNVAVISNSGLLESNNFVDDVTITATYNGFVESQIIEVTPSDDAPLDEVKLLNDLTLSQLKAGDEVTVSGVYEDESKIEELVVKVTSVNKIDDVHSVKIMADNRLYSVLSFDGTDQELSTNLLEVNTAPVITSSPVVSADVDAEYKYAVKATDDDAGDTLTYSLSEAPEGMTIDAKTGVITWIPTVDQIGAALVNVTVTDDGADNLTAHQQFPMVVNSANVAPTIVSNPITTAKEGMKYTYKTSVIDENGGDQFTYTKVEGPEELVIDETSGVITWTPTSSQAGSYDVIFSVVDNGTPQLGTDQSFSIVVAESNVAPQITSSTLKAAKEGEAYSDSVIASDANKDTLEFSLDADSTPANMSMDKNGVISWTPGADQSGKHDIRVTVKDDGTPSMSSTKNLSIVVAESNVAPVITSTPVLVANEKVAYTYNVVATDANNDALSYALTTSPDGMAIDQNGKITWIPSDVQAGSQNVVVTVTDKGIPALPVAQTFSINVAESNVAPVITSTHIETANEGLVYDYTVTATDANGDEPRFKLVNAPTDMKINEVTGKISWTPTNAQVGQQRVDVVAFDEGTPAKESEPSIFFINVAEENVAPVIQSSAPVEATPGVVYKYNFFASDANTISNGDSLSFSLATPDNSSLPEGMAIDLENEEISWVPTAAHAEKSYSVILTVKDDGIPSYESSEEFTINVGAYNNPPMITSDPVTIIEAGVPYIYDVIVDELDSDILTFSLEDAPEGMSIDKTSGQIIWDNHPISGSYNVVVVVKDNGVPVESDTQTFSVGVEDLKPPTKPENLVARTWTETQINLNWNASTDLGTGVSGYRIYENDSLVGDVNVNRFAISGRVPGVTYTYTVKAYDVVGNESLLSDSFSIAISSFPYSEDFSSENLEEWRIIDTNVDKKFEANWSIKGGEFVQSEERGVFRNRESRYAALDGTYHLGTYAYLPGLQHVSNYRLSVDMTPINESTYSSSDDGHDIGVMFRYQSDNNYYRLSLNTEYGFSRVERKLDGVFTTIARDTRGYSAEGKKIKVVVEVMDDLVQIFIDGEARFAFQDSSFDWGGVALYTQDGAKFDNVSLDVNNIDPSIVIDKPEAFTALATTNIAVSAVAMNVDAGATVEFDIDGAGCDNAVEVSKGYFTSTCVSLSSAEHTVNAVLYDATHTPLDSDSNEKVGAQGDVRIALGDSLTNGIADTYSTDAHSTDGKVIAQHGYTPILQGLLTKAGIGPQIIFNEGVPGDKTRDILDSRIDSILERHPGATIAQITIGTNDSEPKADNVTPKTFSGLGNSDWGTYKHWAKLLIKKLRNAGVNPIFAQVPPALDGVDPANSKRNEVIQEYNEVIRDELGVEMGPDLYTYFLGAGENRVSLYEDSKLHFNGLAYDIVARLWEHYLTGGTDLPARIDLPLVLENICVRSDSLACQLPLTYKQDLMEVGSQYYIDNTAVIKSVPGRLKGGVWIRTANSDVNNTREDYLSFNVDRDVDVYIAYEGAEIPDWMAGYVDEGVEFNIGSTVMHLYKKSFSYQVDTSADGTIQLGGNLATGAVDAVTNYAVIVNAQ